MYLGWIQDSYVGGSFHIFLRGGGGGGGGGGVAYFTTEEDLHFSKKIIHIKL